MLPIIFVRRLTFLNGCSIIYIKNAHKKKDKDTTRAIRSSQQQEQTTTIDDTYTPIKISQSNTSRKIAVHKHCRPPA
jgi:hypothetical protein